MKVRIFHTDENGERKELTEGAVDAYAMGNFTFGPMGAFMAFGQRGEVTYCIAPGSKVEIEVLP